MKFSYLIPSTPEMSALTWMLRVWQSEFPQGASIDTVARRCVEQSAAAFGEPVKGMKNDEYQRVYMLSIELANFGLLFAPAPRAPLVYRPARLWYEYVKPAPEAPEIEEPEYAPTPQDQTLSIAPTGSERCTYRLQRQEKPYPRTCEVCGLGPCRFSPRERNTPL